MGKLRDHTLANELAHAKARREGGQFQTLADMFEALKALDANCDDWQDFPAHAGQTDESTE